jgi:hypothetical protein
VIQVVELTEASSEETEQRLKNEQYRLVFPLRLRKSSKTSSENTGNQTPSKRETKKKE